MYVYIFYVSIIYSSRFLNGFLKRSLIIVLTLHTTSSIIPSHTPSHLILWEGLGNSSTQRLSPLKTVPPVIHPKDSPEDVSHSLLIYIGEAQGSHRKTVQQIQEPVTRVHLLRNCTCRTGCAVGVATLAPLSSEFYAACRLYGSCNT